MSFLSRKYPFFTTGVILIVAAMLATSAALAASDNDVEYHKLDNGGVEIEFNNGCRVSFDRRGVLSGDRGGCKNQQLERADDYADDFFNGRHNANEKGSKGKRIPEDKMAKFCKGEASDMLDTRPKHLNTNDVLRQGKKYLVNGYTDDHSATFECYFNKHGEFKNIEVHKYSRGHGPNDGRQ